MKLLTLLIGSFILLNSCCTKKKCAILEKEIQLSGFTAEELDTIQMVYANNPTDTIFGSGRYSSDSSYTTLSNHPDKRSDVTILIPAADRQFSLTNFTYVKKQVDCNQCFLQKEYTDEFAGCNVNGVQQGTEIVLVK